MLRRLALRDFVIVPALELDFDAGFSVLTGETGAGKSILIDALQLALGHRGDAGVVREGAARAEVSAEFDTPESLRPWLDEAGFDPGDTLLLRRSIDAQGKSRAWVNGSPATITQLREAADALLDIHGQHAWQSLTRPVAVRALLDAQAGVQGAEMAARFAAWKQAADALERARERSDEIVAERERLAWTLTELDRLAPGDAEWPELNAEHQRLAHAQALLDGAQAALAALSEGEPSAQGLAQRALDAIADVSAYDERLGSLVDVLQGAIAQLDDAAHTLNHYLGHAELDPQRLGELDARLAAWMGQARRLRKPPEELPALRTQMQQQLKDLDAATDLERLEQALAQAERHWRDEALRVSAARRRAAGPLAASVTTAMQQLGMAGGRFDVAFQPQDKPQAFGLESAELLVAGHAGSTPRPLAKVASGGELSRLALAIAVTTAAAQQALGQAAPTLIFDEIDAGIGGAVGDTVGALMKQLGASAQVLAVTHLAQVAACGDHHFVVAKSAEGGAARSQVRPVSGEARVAEVARMLGGEKLSGTAHAQAMLEQGAAAAAPAPAPRKRSSKA
ncbi:DNA repair protein RecN [Burkholderiales bacterium JOSHI_001]|nr:DNA repair protein RecN [Burkholderiales bacterium JOSHI_001]